MGRKASKQPHLDAVAGHDAGGLLGKLLRVVAAVKAHHNTAVHSLLSFGLDDLGKGLGGVADDVDIHPVQADGHGAAQTGGAELQRTEEPALDLFGIICDGSKLCLLRLAQRGGREPLLISFHVSHRDTSSVSFYL